MHSEFLWQLATMATVAEAHGYCSVYGIKIERERGKKKCNRSEFKSE